MDLRVISRSSVITQRAMNQLHAKFAKNPQWANVEARLFVCPRTEEVDAVLKSWGILDNMARSVSLSRFTTR